MDRFRIFEVEIINLFEDVKSHKRVSRRHTHRENY